MRKHNDTGRSGETRPAAAAGLPVLRLSLQMVIDELEENGVETVPFGNCQEPRFRRVEVFDGQTDMRDDTLYFVSERFVSGQSANGPAVFPADRYAYVTAVKPEAPASRPEAMKPGGAAPHLVAVNPGGTKLLNLLLETFSKYHDFEAQLNLLIASGGSLDDVCRLAGKFFGNPMYIHDQYFTVIAMPVRVVGMIDFDENPETGQLHIPLSLIEDFKFNQKYEETLAQKHAMIWDTQQYPHWMRSLYVNLWDGEAYRGRLLIDELQSLLKPGQFALADYLGECVIRQMRLHDGRTVGHYRDHENTMLMLLQNGEAHPADVRALLTALDWKREDRYLCLCLQSQSRDFAISSDYIFRSHLIALFPGNLCLFPDRQLCLILNLTQLRAESADAHHRIAPLLRDSLMYAGMSEAGDGFDSLPNLYRQAQIALDFISRWKDDRWVLSFGECAPAYLREHLRQTLTPVMPLEYWTAQPIRLLKKHDEENGSDLLRTLMVYLENGMSIPETSRKLIIHRTTLLYRLKRIREIAQADLDDPRVRLYLQLSFYLLEL